MIKLLRSKKAVYLAGIILVTSSYTLISEEPIPQGKTYSASEKAASQKAFLAVYDVLMSPRCMNCHPKGDVPLQGDDSHLHTQGVIRGTDGHGVYAMKCTNCHQPKNTPGLNMPPGNPKWHLPPADMKMVFEGKTPRELAAQLKDPEQNGHKTMAEIVDHISHDELVLGGWNPGDGRKKPPLTHPQFEKEFRDWVKNGAVLPEK
ncbi:MAG: hypothetical protein V4725_15865 [Bacteroidota bacterium]